MSKQRKVTRIKALTVSENGKVSPTEVVVINYPDRDTEVIVDPYSPKGYKMDHEGKTTYLYPDSSSQDALETLKAERI